MLSTTAALSRVSSLKTASNAGVMGVGISFPSKSLGGRFVIVGPFVTKIIDSLYKHMSLGSDNLFLNCSKVIDLPLLDSSLSTLLYLSFTVYILSLKSTAMESVIIFLERDMSPTMFQSVTLFAFPTVISGP